MSQDVDVVANKRPGRTQAARAASTCRQTESSQHLSSVTSDGLLLEYETLELRLHPPNVQIDNDTYDDVTVITIDSANRPGTLIEARRGLDIDMGAWPSSAAEELGCRCTTTSVSSGCAPIRISTLQLSVSALQ